MRTPHEPEFLEPALRRAEADLVRRLEEACAGVEQKDLSQESMQELLRLEEELLAAARAVEQAVRLRLQLGQRPASARGADTSTTPAAEPAPDEGATAYRVREFKDQAGTEWRVWQVRPRSAGRANAERYLGEYFKGWLAFEQLGGDLRKRLPRFPEEWIRVSDEELYRLLQSAVDVPQRKARSEGGEARP
jgi:hypothetical protein